MKFPTLLVLFFAALQSARALPEAELQRFIDEAVKAGGGEVIIPPGEHLIERGLVLNEAKKLRIIGLDAEETVLKAGKDASALIQLGLGCENVRIEKLTFDGAPSAIGEWHDAGDAGKNAGKGIAKILLSRCFFQNQTGDAVLLPMAAVDGLSVEDCSFRDVGEAAIHFGEQTSGSSITHNQFIRCRSGVSLNGSRKCLVASNELKDCRTGILITGTKGEASAEQGNIIAINAIVSSGENGIQFGLRTQKNSALQNEIAGSGRNGIQLEGEGNVVKGNKISSSGGKDITVIAGGHEIVE